jgi:3-phytase
MRGPAVVGALGALALAWSLQPVAEPGDRLLRLETDALVLTGRGGVIDSLPVDGEVEAIDADGGLVLLRIDGEDGVLRLVTVGRDGLAESRLAVDIDVEGLCLARIDAGSYDLFLLDGEGGLFHNWLTPGDEPRLQPVRRLAVNPDSAICDVSTERVLVLNEPMGIVSYARDPETDPVMAPEYLPAPPGTPRADLVAFRWQPAGLDVQDDEGRAWRVPRDGDARALPDTDWRSWDPDLATPLADGLPVVVAAGETAPVLDAFDAADDPAIITGSNGSSWIVGTNKRRGLIAYDLDGTIRHRVDRGRLNNVDALPLGGNRFLLAASNRTTFTLDLFVADLAADEFRFVNAIPVVLDDPYGLCMGELPGGARNVFIGGTDGTVLQWRIDDDFGGELVATHRFDSQTEGCVYDEQRNRVFIGEEAAGIWAVDLASGEMSPFAGVDDGLLVPDVEGLDICRRDSGRWLVASSQGDDRYVVYDLAGDRPPLKFAIGPDRAAGIDGASETDGLACSAGPVSGYPSGILVVQDGRNRAPDENQNFTVVDWRDVDALLHGKP